jgi:sulfocyanin
MPERDLFQRGVLVTSRLLLATGLLLVAVHCQRAEEAGVREDEGAADRAIAAEEKTPAEAAGDSREVTASADTPLGTETPPERGRAESQTAPADTDTATAGERAAAGTGDAARGGAGSGVEWMKVDEANKQVDFEIVAGRTADNSAWNFNGYANGDLTITVPPGWTVTMRFSSRDADVPHSLYIIDEKPPFPTVMPDAPAIPKAYSINLKNGIGPGQKDTLRFVVEKAGEFIMACGVPGHAASGMWDYFVVSAEARRPSVTVKS